MEQVPPLPEIRDLYVLKMIHDTPKLEKKCNITGHCRWEETYGDALYDVIYRNFLGETFRTKHGINLPKLLEDHGKSKTVQGRIGQFYNIGRLVRTEPKPDNLKQYAKLLEVWLAAFFLDRLLWGGDAFKEAADWLGEVWRIRYRSVLCYVTLDFPLCNRSMYIKKRHRVGNREIRVDFCIQKL